MKKKLIIVSVLVFSLVFGTVPVMADDTVTSSDFDDYAVEKYGESFLEEYSYSCFYDITDDDIYGAVKIYSKTPLYIGTRVDFGSSGSSCVISNYPYDSDNVRRVMYTTSGFSTDRSFAVFGTGATVDFIYSTIIESSHDIYFLDGSVFFQRTLFPIMAPIAGTVDLMEVMTELIGVVPLVVGLVVSCLGLRKGWSLLVRNLHRA